LVDGEEAIGDSDRIIAHLKRRYDPGIDHALSPGQLNLDFLVRRTLDDLYWPMSFSRWRDDRFWPSFRDAILATHADVSASDLEAAREYNRLRYHYQGIGRYEPEQVYARGIDDLRVVADLLGDDGFVFKPEPTTVDAAIYGFVANIYFYEIDTPLKQYVLSRPALVRHCEAIHERINIELRVRVSP
jgi:glutathione S-transferase